MSIFGSGYGAVDIGASAYQGNPVIAGAVEISASAAGLMGIVATSVTAGVEVSATAEYARGNGYGAVVIAGHATGTISPIGTADWGLRISSPGVTGLVGIVGTASGAVRASGAATGYHGINGTASATVTISAYARGAASETSAYGFSMNTESLGCALYTGFTFNSLWKGIDGQYYGSNSTGVHRLSGTTDNGTAIIPLVRTPLSDFGKLRKMWFRDLYLNATTTGTPQIRVASKAFDYTLVAADYVTLSSWIDHGAGTNGSRVKRGKMPRDFSPRYVQIEFSMPNGEAVAVDEIVLPFDKSRRS